MGYVIAPIHYQPNRIHQFVYQVVLDAVDDSGDSLLIEIPTSCDQIERWLGTAFFGVFRFGLKEHLA